MSKHDPKRGSVAIVGLGAVLPDAYDVDTFWNNLKTGRASISQTPADRWDPALYYDPDPKAPDKTYSKIGGWVRDFAWTPFDWKMPIPPTVSDAMDRTQKWALAAARQALVDYGYPERRFDKKRCAVIVGNAMGGDKHYLTALRIYAPEYLAALGGSEAFQALPAEQRARIAEELVAQVRGRLPPINEDTMPGELANIIAGRIAAIFDLHGPNYVADAACASAMAAMSAAVEGLEEGYYDLALAGGVDANMSASTFVKFSKIGALSATGTRPYDEGADGFVMGEGAALFVLKRIADAERDEDRIYAVVRGIGGASDGKGKGITAPNPVGQRLAIEAGWAAAAERPTVDTYLEGHGTSTRVGDVVEVNSLIEAMSPFGLPRGCIPLGSVKSNIGHLKGGAGAAGLMKAALALYHGQIPPSIGVETPNPKIDFANSPLFVNRELRDWRRTQDEPRRAGVSAFGFGGTNFHAVLEEHEPGRLTKDRASTVAVPAPLVSAGVSSSLKAPLRGSAVLGAADLADLRARLSGLTEAAEAGRTPPRVPPDAEALRSPVRLGIDFGDAPDLVRKAKLAAKALATSNPLAMRALEAQGVLLSTGERRKVAFLYTGQGSQYVNMMRRLGETEPVVRATVQEADEILTPILGRPLSEFIYADPNDEAAMAAANRGLRQTAITQPAVLTVDIAMTRLMAEYGIVPDLVMGHSLGEYGAMVAAGGLSFAHALEAVAARGAEMTKVSVADNGKMAAIMGPMAEVEQLVAEADGYVVVANINSRRQAVIGGESAAVEAAVERCAARGLTATMLPVSHAFHTRIVAPASGPLQEVLRRLDVRGVQIPLVGNVTGELYPTGPDARDQMIDLLGQQIASPVQFVKGLETLYEKGARVFVEMGPKKALCGMAEDVLGDREDVLCLFTNHPKLADDVAFNKALTGLYAAGHGAARSAAPERPRADDEARGNGRAHPAPAPVLSAPSRPSPQPGLPLAAGASAPIAEVGKLFAKFMEDSFRVMGGAAAAPPLPVMISGASVGLPGRGAVFRDDNMARLLGGEQLIDAIPMSARRRMVERHITRLVKTKEGTGSFETIESPTETIKLAGQRGEIGLVERFGFPKDRMPALDVATELAIGAGIDALRDAGLPLVMHYKTTTRGTFLPERWMLPEPLRDETGVIFGSAFPGYDALAKEMDAYRRHREIEAKQAELEATLGRHRASMTPDLAEELERRVVELSEEARGVAYTLDRRFLFRILAMGHAQFAEYIGARGPNTQVNAACASGTQALGMAQDWIRAGRCRRVIVLSADDVTSEALLPWIGSGFLASGAAATDELVEQAALPFDHRRHGLVLGMGAAALVVEREDAIRERGMRPIAEVMATRFVNSAFHGTRLNPPHIAAAMEAMVAEAERAYGLSRAEMARHMVFVSHETYTPARGGSAQGEVQALRSVFGAAADDIVIANTKGMTGHAMGTGIEDVLGLKALETGLVPPVPAYTEVDEALGHLNLSKGGAYPVQFALRLGAGFGSQLALSLMRWVPTPDGRRPSARALGFETRIEDAARWQGWLSEVSGHAGAKVEVERRTLRIEDVGPPDAAVHDALAPKAEPKPVAPIEAVLAPPPVAPGRAEALAPAPAAVREPPRAEPGPDPVQARILEIVSEQTGYPEDMLDPELDLEADLGIDTVKQAETFAAVRESYDIERDPNLQLRDFNTLEKVVGFVYDRRPDLKASASAAAPATTEAVAPAAPADAPLDAVRDKVMQIIAAQTGYPEDMLDPELDLEADLGIDTVKQAETFAAVRESYGIERDPNLQLRDFNTIHKVVGFVRDRATGLVADEAAPAEAARRSAPVLEGSVEAAAAIPRRVPTLALRPGLERCVDTGVILDAGTRVVVMADAGGVADALQADLSARGVTVLRVDDSPGADELASRLAAWLEAGPVHGVFWLAALDDEGPFEALTLEDFTAGVHRRVKLLFRTMRALYAANDGRGAFLVAGTRLGGGLGLGAAPATAPLGGGVCGFVKTYARERPEALVKLADFGGDDAPAAVAAGLVEEALKDPGAVEVARGQGLRRTLTLLEEPVEDGGSGLTLDSDTVFFVTGAAGSITSAIVADLTRAAGGGRFYLLDLAPAPDPSDPDLQAFLQDREGLKRTLFDRLKAAGEAATPKVIEERLAALEREAAASTAISEVEAAGGVARYCSLDLRDHEAVTRIVDEVRSGPGRIDVLLHAGGLEISRMLPDKSPEEYDLVFDVKAQGWFSVLRAARDLEVGASVVFSSIAGRFGNAGQADYAAANELLAKTSFALRGSGTRAIVMDWTAWDGIGMATRGSIPKMMARAGIDLLPPEAGIAFVRRELVSGGRADEVVVAQGLGVMLEARHPTGGLAEVDTSETGPMLTRVVGFGAHSGLQTEVDLDPAQPFLDHHRIDGTPVLPGVMGIEAFCEAAAVGLPGWRVAEVTDVRFLAPFKLYRSEPRTAKVEAVFVPDGDAVRVECRLYGERTLATQSAVQTTLHFEATVVMRPDEPAAETADVPEPNGHSVDAGPIYEVYFHGPAYQVVGQAWGAGRTVGARMASDLGPNHAPSSRPLLATPRLVELCFQAAGVAEIGLDRRLALPASLARVRWPKTPAEPQGELFCWVEPEASGEGVRARVVDASGAVWVELEGYRTIALPAEVPEAQSAPLAAALR